jgi:hypothetical protein
MAIDPDSAAGHQATAGASEPEPWVVAQACEVLVLRCNELEEVLLGLEAQVAALSETQQVHQAQLLRLQQRAVAPAQRAPQRRSRRPHRRVLLACVLALFGLGFVLVRLAFDAPSLPERSVRATAPLPARATTLYLTMRGSTWLEVRDPSGKLLHYGMAQPGELSFAVRPQISIRAGRPDLVDVVFDSFRRPLGAIGDIDWHRFSVQ